MENKRDEKELGEEEVEKVAGGVGIVVGDEDDVAGPIEETGVIKREGKIKHPIGYYKN